jgi:hypothetical protein
VYTKRLEVAEVSSNDYPPRNRRAEPLPCWLVEIVHKDGIKTFDPVGLILYVIRRGEELLKLKPMCGLYSDVSNQPAVLYRSNDVEIALSPEELYRLASYSLHCGEYQRLRNEFGIFHEIDAKHYPFELSSSVELQAI